MFKWSHHSNTFYFYYKCGFSTFEELRKIHGTSYGRITSHVLIVRSPFKRKRGPKRRLKILAGQFQRCHIPATYDACK